MENVKIQNRVTPNYIKLKEMNGKQLLNVAMALIISLFTFSSCDKEEHVSADKMPNEVLAYAKTHFPDNEIIDAKIEKDDFTKSYELYLKGGFTLEFNKNKEITEIKGRTKLPDSVINPNILAYVGDNYPENFIIGWELEGKNQQVELDNGTDLEFTMDGEFIRIDF